MYTHYNIKEIEESVFSFWHKEKIDKKQKEQHKGNKTFTFLQGPPYTSGKLHTGHAWNSTLKDIILRYKKMTGHDVWDRAGYDMHGLPTETKVSQALGLKSKEDIEAFGLARYAKECKKFSIEKAQDMNKDLQRLAIWLDFDDPYYPISDNYINGVWWLIKQAHKKERLYEGFRTVYWDYHNETALAKHELDYKSVKDKSIFVKFKVASSDNEYFVIWTTTPWTIAYNLAIMVHPDIDYAKVLVGDQTLIIAEALVDTVMKKARIDKKDYSIAATCKGEELAGKEYIHPFHDSLAHIYDPIKKDAAKTHSVVLAKDLVTLEAGSGLVHCAPGCGPEDYEIGRQNGMPPFNTIKEDGTYPQDMAEFAGFHAKKDNQAFIEALKDRDALVAQEIYIHDYPHGERSKEPVIFRATKQWFLKTEDLKEQFLTQNSEIEWNPKEAKNAFNSWLSNIRDNSITKQRFWGCPLPIWRCEETGEIVVIESKEELEALCGHPVEDMHKPYIDTVEIPLKDGNVAKRIPDVLDVWIDAGTLAWNCYYYPERKELFERYFPADIIIEGKDQIRGWFNVLMVCSNIAFDTAPFKNVFMNGFLTAVDGEKMSKSLGNVISPYEIVDKYGADTLRSYFSRAAAGKDIKFSWDEIAQKQRNLLVLWNTHKYLLELCELHKIDPKALSTEKMQALYTNDEKYILSLAQSTIKKATATLDTYAINEAIPIIEELYLEISRTYVQQVRDKASSGTQEEKELVAHTLYTTLKAAITIQAIVTPYTCEAIFQNFKEAFNEKEESVHLLAWPIHKETDIDAALEERMQVAQSVIQGILAAREKAKVNRRWPLQEAIVVSTNTDVLEAVTEFEDMIKGQTNVKTLLGLSSYDKVEEEVTVNPGKIGQDFAKDTPKVIKAFKALSREEKERFTKDIITKTVAPLTLEDGQSVEIFQRHCTITRDVPENVTAAEAKNANVYLNTALTEELEAEGFMRELTRQLQQARKESGCDKSDVIEAYIHASSTLVDKVQMYKDDIAQKCGAQHLTVSSDKAHKHFEHNSDITIKDENVTVSLSKL